MCLKYFAVNFDGSEFDEYNKKPEEWVYQYYKVFTDKTEALEFANKKLIETLKKKQESSHSIIQDYKMKWLKLLFKYEPEKFSGGRFPAWYHNDIKEASNGTILI